ncbi:MAG: hypothetical protein GY861_03780 [bacterium]|nr:hypothetical protein [bacterium]
MGEVNGKKRIPKEVLEKYKEVLSGGRRQGLSGRELRRWAYRAFKKTEEYTKLATVPFTEMGPQEEEI